MTKMVRWITHAGDFNTNYMIRVNIVLTELDALIFWQVIVVWMPQK